MNRTDPRVIKTLHRIDESLLENLNHYDFPKITVEMLCNEAKINRSTFYKYYKDKYDLLNDYLNRTLKEFSEATEKTGFILATPYTIDSKEYLENFRNMIVYIYEHRHIYKTLWKSTLCRPVYQEMENCICNNILLTVQENLDDTIQITPYHELYSRLFASNLMTLVKWWLKNEPAITLSDVESVMKGNMKSSLFALVKSQENQE